jgi:hypothetical protein
MAAFSKKPPRVVGTLRDNEPKHRLEAESIIGRSRGRGVSSVEMNIASVSGYMLMLGQQL